MQKITFIKNAAPLKLAYFKDDTIEVGNAEAKELKELGFARDWKPEDEKTQEPGAGDLPQDLPGRDALIAAGFKTLDDIKGVEDLTDIKGIGKVLASQLIDYMQH